MTEANRFARPARVLGGILWMALLTGCMPDFRSEHPPPRIYWLEATAAESPPAMAVTVSLVPGLDTDRIWVLEPDQRLNYYAGAFWPDRLQPLLQSVLDRSLGTGAEGADVRVLVERFFAVAGSTAGPPMVALTARIEAEGRRCPFDGRHRAQTDRLRDIVAAHQALIDELVDAVARTVRSGACG